MDLLRDLLQALPDLSWRIVPQLAGQPVLMLILAVLLAPALGAGRSYGITNLVWHEEPRKQLLNGLGYGMALALIVFVAHLEGYAIWSRALPNSLRDLSWPSQEFVRFACYLGALLTLILGIALALLLLGGVAALRARIERPKALTPPNEGVKSRRPPFWPLPIGVGVGLGLVLFVFILFDAILADEDINTLAIYRAFLTMSAVLAFLVNGWRSQRIQPGVPPVYSLCALMALLAIGYGWMTSYATYYSASVLTTLILVVVGGVLVAIAGLTNSRIRLPIASHFYESPADLNEDPPRVDPSTHPEPISIGQFRANCLAGDRPIVLIATSGGGITAAAWTVAVIQEAERTVPGLIGSTRLITGASGGMVGAGLLVSNRVEPFQPNDDTPDIGPTPDPMFNAISADCLSPVVSRWFFNDLVNILPIPASYDRGLALESSWDRNLAGALQKKFSETIEPERRGAIPSLIFAPMMVEDGRRLLISNLDLGFLSENRGASTDDHKRESGSGDPIYNSLYSRSHVEFFRFTDHARTLTLGTAARLSATFPLVSPAVTLPFSPRRRAVDAGYYDNYGVNLCMSWLLANADWIKEHRRRVVLIEIRAGQLESASRTASHVPSHPLKRGLEMLSTPLQGLLTARSSVMSFRNDEQVSLASRLLNRNERRPLFNRVVLECPADVPLSWYLTTNQKMTIRSAVRASAIQARLGALKHWWDSSPNALEQGIEDEEVIEAPCPVSI